MRLLKTERKSEELSEKEQKKYTKKQNLLKVFIMDENIKTKKK